MKKKTEKQVVNQLWDDKENTYDLLEFNIMSDLETFVRKYEILFKKLHKEALKIDEDDLYQDYKLSKKTESIQSMARIVYYLNCRLPDGLECCSLEDFFMDSIVDRYSECEQENGKSIWKFLLVLGEHLNEASMYIGFLDNDLAVAEEYKKRKKHDQKK